MGCGDPNAENKCNVEGNQAHHEPPPPTAKPRRSSLKGQTEVVVVDGQVIRRPSTTGATASQISRHDMLTPFPKFMAEVHLDITDGDTASIPFSAVVNAFTARWTFEWDHDARDFINKPKEGNLSLSQTNKLRISLNLNPFNDYHEAYDKMYQIVEIDRKTVRALAEPHLVERKKDDSTGQGMAFSPFFADAITPKVQGKFDFRTGDVKNTKVPAEQKVLLVSIDGWGLSQEEKGNALSVAETPVMDDLSQNSLCTGIKAHGLDVGLPDGVMGNSEVGHLTMGVGRVNFQDLVRINKSIEDESFKQNERLLAAVNRAKDGNGRLHLMGLVSDGAVHSHIEHFKAFIRFAKEMKVPETYLHFFADGRDTPPKSGHKYMQEMLDFIKELEYGTFASVVGRYYAMDRDKRWERIELAYNLLVNGDGEETNADKLIEVVQRRYDSEGETDEFLKPILVNRNGVIGDGDTMILMDFRSDRMREIAEALGVKPPFETEYKRDDTHLTTMTQYNAEFPMPVLYLPQTNPNCLSEWLSKHNKTQYHTAETEKYAHVTFFFNGGVEQAFDGEDRFVVPSPKVATYDLQPEMSVHQVAEKVNEAIKSKKYHFVMCNLAPPDMVGHTGNFEKTVEACEHTDTAIGAMLKSCRENGFVMIITSDHGNCEEMLQPNGKPKTAHTSNLVPLIVDLPPAIKANASWNRSEGGLQDVAPMVLQLMDLPVPTDMGTRPPMIKFA